MHCLLAVWNPNTANYTCTSQVLFTEKAAAAMAATSAPQQQHHRDEGARGSPAAATSLSCGVQELSAVVEAAVSIALVHPNIVTV